MMEINREQLKVEKIIEPLTIEETLDSIFELLDRAEAELDQAPEIIAVRDGVPEMSIREVHLPNDDIDEFVVRIAGLPDIKCRVPSNRVSTVSVIKIL